MKKLLIAFFLLFMLVAPKAEAANNEWVHIFDTNNRFYVFVDVGNYEITQDENGERVFKVTIANYMAATKDNEQSGVFIKTEIYEKSLRYKEGKSYYFKGKEKIGERDRSENGWRKFDAGTNGETILKNAIKAVLNREAERSA